MTEEQERYLVRLAGYFSGLVTEGRGDSARGRNFHALHFLDFVWSQPHLPLYSYRPSRNPAAFLVMVFDLLGDHLHGYSQHVLEHMLTTGGARGQSLLQQDLGRRLRAPWSSFIMDLTSAGLPTLSMILDDTVKAGLRVPARSQLPQYLRRLKLYMTAKQLAELDISAFIDNLSVAEILGYLNFTGVPEVGEERHPAGGDLRQVIRRTFDAVWSQTLERQEERNLVTFFASLPVNGLRLVELAGAAREAVECGFAVFYARVTDAKAPGRLWHPPPAFLEASEEEWQHFAFLTAREAQDALGRRLHGPARLGLSNTFPATTRALDAWLEHEDCFRELHAHRSWHAAVERAKDSIAQERTRFLNALARELIEAGHD